ncbi:MAG TPA: thymidine kinase, partial [Porphyromonadaceae bacterium]|nr:thymidine kinase [Porphyromonadaceae bacterium]
EKQVMLGEMHEYQPLCRKCYLQEQLFSTPPVNKF